MTSDTILSMETQEYTKRLGKISSEQFQKALHQFNLGEFIKAEAIPFGLFGQNVFITSTTGEYVLRGRPHYNWQFPTEKFFAELIHSKTKVPVPYPYFLDESTDIFGWSYILIPRMQGIQISNNEIITQLTMEDRETIAKALAHTLVELHTIKWEYSGIYDIESKTITKRDNYRNWLIEQMYSLLSKAKSYNNNTLDSDITWVENVIRTAKPALDAQFEPGIVMRDFKEANTVVQKVNDEWKVTGVFDLMEIHMGDSESDLARLVGHYLRNSLSRLADAYVTEYFKLSHPQQGFIQRQKVYSLYDSAIIWEYNQRERGGISENPRQSFRDWTEPTLEFWSNLRY